MALLAASGLFREETVPGDGAAAAEPCYHLTTASRLLVDDDAKGGRNCVSQLFTLCSPFYFTASQNLAEWLQEGGGGGADAVHDGARRGFLRRRQPRRGVRRVLRRGDGLGQRRVRRGAGRGGVPGGRRTVRGHNGTTARAIARAFPHVKCWVLDLPRVVDTMPADGTVEFVAGDMREFIPPADAVLFKVRIYA
jgi:trans-resveratrol di-O-methyltransferase